MLTKLLLVISAVCSRQLIFQKQLLPQVYRCNIPTEEVAHQLHQWTQDNEADIWSNEQFRLGHVDIAITDDLQVHSSCSLLLSQARVKSLLVEEKVFRGGDFERYHSFDGLMGMVDDIVDSSSIAKKKVIGMTSEGRDIVVVHLTTGSDKPIIWISGGVHAREWVSSHATTYLMKKLVKGHKQNDPLVQEMLKNFEFIIAPHYNPDGYEYSRKSSRWWRKNRRQNKDGSFGVDLNRNFDIKWGQGGSSRSPRSDTYMGPYAASEPEVKSVQDYVGDLIESGRVVTIGLDIHSYGQLIMRPYGNSRKLHPQEARNKKLGDFIRDQMERSGGALYTSQTSAGLYPITGGSDDYFTIKWKATGFTWELRDTGRYGFMLPPALLLPTCKEVWVGVQAMSQFLIDEKF